MPEVSNVTNLYQYLTGAASKLKTRCRDIDFINVPTISIPVEIAEKEITGLQPGSLSAGYLETKFGKLIFKTPQEAAFIQKCANDPEIKYLSNCQISVPYINESGKIATLTPAFYVNITQIVDVTNVITQEHRFKNFWIQEYLTNEPEFKEMGLLYKIALLEEKVSIDSDTRPSFHRIFMDFANSVAKRSVSQKLQVGSVITSADSNIIFSFGYNGDEKGGSNQPVVDETGKHEDTVHSEYNALIKLDFNSPQDKILYVTHSPCLKCARSIVNANIKLVIFNQVYKDTAGVNLLRARGIRVVQYNYGEIG